VDVGSSYLPSDLLAAYLLAQLEACDTIQQRRLALWREYDSGLRPWARRFAVQLPCVPAECVHPAHMFYLVLPTLAARTAFIAHMRERQILAVFHYQPLHLSEMGQRLGGRAGQCPVTEDIADRLVRLPLYFQLTAADQQRVIEAATSFTC
jgi:dTDP-4-amino-4,6-dideoxygalactose transaminase